MNKKQGETRDKQCRGSVQVIGRWRADDGEMAKSRGHGNATLMSAFLGILPRAKHELSQQRMGGTVGGFVSTS